MEFSRTRKSSSVIDNIRTGRLTDERRSARLVATVFLLIFLAAASCGGGGGGGGGASGGGATGGQVNGMNDLDVPPGFQFGTTRDVDFNFTVTDLGGAPWESVVIILSSGTPEAETEFGRCVTGTGGTATLSREIPAHITEVRIHTAAIGISDLTVSVTGAGPFNCTLSVAGNSCS